jgi:hypothetical protein
MLLKILIYISKCEVNKYTLWLFNIAMEHGPFIDDFLIKTTIYKGLSMAMLNNQMVTYITLLHRKLNIWLTRGENNILTIIITRFTIPVPLE